MAVIFVSEPLFSASVFAAAPSRRSTFGAERRRA